MLEGISDTMNLDLNLDPSSETEEQSLSDSDECGEELSHPSEPVWGPAACSPQHVGTQPLVLIDGNHFTGSSESGTPLQTGEGSIAAEERLDGGLKTCENACETVGSNLPDKKEDEEKNSDDSEGFFDCNICLETSKEPVVTCCGHLFCWTCLYQWLHYHSDAKECPVCKGEVTLKAVTPIYGRGNVKGTPDDNPDVKVPARPAAQRFESIRQTIHRAPLFIPMGESFRRVQSSLDMESQQSLDLSNHGTSESRDTANSLFYGLLSSQRRGREQNLVSAVHRFEIDLAQNISNDVETADARLQYLFLQRNLPSQRAPSVSSLPSARYSSNWAIQAPISIRRHMGRTPTQNRRVPLYQRDSLARTNSESQVNANVLIDSLVPRTTSATGRRNGIASRNLNVDSADARVRRRRRFR